jgi:hypothetical protein
MMKKTRSGMPAAYDRDRWSCSNDVVQNKVIAGNDSAG